MSQVEAEAKDYSSGEDDNVNFFTIALFIDELTYLYTKLSFCEIS